jgi:simple sugar transport system permease protein
MDFFDMLVSILGSTVRLTIPLLFTALAGLFSERAGVFDIGLEGKMLAAAFASACVAYLTANPWAGLLAGIAVSILFSLIHGFAVITNRGNQIVSGVALNFIAAGLTVVLGQAWFGQGGRTPQLPGEGRFAPIILPGADAMRDFHRPTLCHCHFRQHYPHLSRLSGGAAVLVGALPHSFRLAPARCR